MSAYTSNGRYLHHGLNEQNLPTIAGTVVTAMATADTLAVQLPSNVDFNILPTSLIVWNPTATPAVPVTTLAITNHNQTTGVTTLTASGTVPAGSYYMMDYAIPPV